MTDYELYTNVENDYYQRGCKAFDKACWWGKLSRIPLIGRFAAKQSDKWDAEGSMCYSISVTAYKKAQSAR